MTMSGCKSSSAFCCGLHFSLFRARPQTKSQQATMYEDPDCAFKDNITERSGTVISAAPSEVKKDEKLVRRARAAVISFLMLAGIAVSALTYTLLSHNETSNFESQVSYPSIGTQHLICVLLQALTRRCNRNAFSYTVPSQCSPSCSHGHQERCDYLQQCRGHGRDVHCLR
jgi:hypothetical protein